MKDEGNRVFKKLHTQDELDQLINEVDWGDAFLREAYFVSPSYLLNDRSVAAPDALPALHLFVALPESETPGIELLFYNVTDAAFTFTTPFDPAGTLRSDAVAFYLISGLETKVIRADRLLYRFCHHTGWDQILGKTNLFDRSGFPNIPAGG